MRDLYKQGFTVYTKCLDGVAHPTLPCWAASMSSKVYLIATGYVWSQGGYFNHREANLPFFSSISNAEQHCSVVHLQLKGNALWETELWGFWNPFFAIPFCFMFFVQWEMQGRGSGLMWRKAVLLSGSGSWYPNGKLEWGWKIGVCFQKLKKDMCQELRKGESFQSKRSIWKNLPMGTL